jgi:DHA1 family multidrug/chloramphenicol efflux transport protein-like MFS transporter
MQLLGLSSREYGLWQIPIFGAVIVGNLILLIVCSPATR